MTLATGARFGPYEIVSVLGAGGMGEVYRARDTKLGRDVALKILPESVAHDPERTARFRREARVLAALNHPHIAAIYGFEEAGPAQFLVLELVDGEPLDRRLSRGPVPVTEAIGIARQIVEALGEAHEKGIIHRDLKPGNVALTSSEKVKVLDFGLAKLAAPSGTVPSASVSMSPTLTTPGQMTGVGTILGTAAYMSPEQAKGREADKRSDIWALGCLLYEMLTGARAFPGDNVSDTLAAILRGEPDWTALPADTPPNVRALLDGCLKKDRKERLGDIAVAQFLLNQASVAASPTTAARRGPRRSTLIVAGAAVLAVSIAASVALTIRLTSKPSGPPMRFAVVPSAAEPFAPQGADRDIAVSPDGRRIVYRAMIGGTAKLVVRDLNQLEGKVVDDSVNARSPFISSDGQWIGFQSVGFLKKIAITGGPSVAICLLSAALRGASWQEDTIVFASADPATGLLSVPSAGGEPSVLTRPDPKNNEGDHVFPHLLPDGRHVLFTIVPVDNRANSLQVAGFDLETKARKIIVRGGSQAQYVAAGALVFATSGTLRAARFDASRAELTSEPVPVVEQMSTASGGSANYAVSRDGLLVYAPRSGADDGGPGRSLVWVSREGREEPIRTDARAFFDPRLSSDEQRVLVEIADDADDIWIVDVNRGTLTRQTFDPLEDETPVWLPDGQSIAYGSARSRGPRGVFRRRADGVGDEESLWTGTPHTHVETATPDGRALILTQAAGLVGRYDLYMLPLDGERKLAPLIRTTFNEQSASISPDGRWIAYSSDETGRDEVYVRAFPSLKGKTPVSVKGGMQPVWSKRGDELFFRGQGAVMAVRVQPGASFSPGPPRKLFDDRFLSKRKNKGYDVSRDGRFLMVKDLASGQTQTGTPASLVVVTNWFEELKARVPTK